LIFGEEEQRSEDELSRLRGSERSEVCSKSFAWPKSNPTKWLIFGEEEQRSEDELSRLRGSERSEVCFDDVRV